ncbi:MAG: hypothetical protein RL385_5094 [Pseudomonadota bacterium]
MGMRGKRFAGNLASIWRDSPWQLPSPPACPHMIFGRFLAFFRTHDRFATVGAQHAQPAPRTGPRSMNQHATDFPASVRDSSISRSGSRRQNGGNVKFNGR